MATKVAVKTDQVELAQYGSVELPVDLGTKRHGQLRVSRRGIHWTPGRSSKVGYELSWKAFGTFMEEQGKKTAR